MFGRPPLLLLLPLLLALPVQSASAQVVPLYAFQTRPVGFPWTMGIGTRVSNAEATVFGHPPRAGAIGEVAVTQRVLSVGDEVPLPVYVNGEFAADDEVFWTAQLWIANFDADGIVRYQNGDHVTATFAGRRFITAQA